MSVVRHIMRSWRSHLFLQISTLTILVGVYATLVVAYGVQKNLQELLLQWGDSVKMTVYLKDGRDKSKDQTLENFLRSTEMFSKVDFISKQDAAQEFLIRMGRFVPNLFSDASFINPLPESYELHLKEAMTTSRAYEKLKQMATEITQNEVVEEVAFGQDWIENYAGALNIFHKTCWFLSLILLSGSLFIIGNSVRSSISQRREEIEILELVGATPTSIRWPFIVEGAVLGFFASLIALGFGYGIYLWQAHLFKDGFNVLGLSSAFVYLGGFEMFFVVLSGCVVGALGSYVCVRKLATGWAAAQRFESDMG